MEEVIEQFQSTLGEASSTTGDDGDGHKTSFDGLYKNWGRLGHQEERRHELLKVQKSNRHQKLDKFRGILDLVKAVEDNVQWDKNSSHHARYRPSIYVAGFNKASHTYRNVLMLSEWLIEKPADFEQNWFVVPCPKGVRMLVVATQGITKCYTKYGQFRMECSTALPGGHHTNNAKDKNQCCVLDCFFIEKTNTMYVLDLLAWNGTPMTDGETDFRNFWLLSKFAEVPGLTSITKQNKLIFKPLSKISCDPVSFQEYFLKYPLFENNFPLLDGLLFYHKKAHYVSGETPLVGWLYPYMVPEVLGSDIVPHPCLALGKPEDYVNQADFIQKFEAKNEKKNKFNRPRRMSTSSCTSETQVQSGGKSKEKTKMVSNKMETELAPAANDAKTTNPETMATEEAKEKGKDKTQEEMDKTRPEDGNGT